MRKNFGANTFLYPMPVLIIASYDENGTSDAMNAAYLKVGEKVGNAFSDGKRIQ